jgi:hypothetical protein
VNLRLDPSTARSSCSASAAGPPARRTSLRCSRSGPTWASARRRRRFYPQRLSTPPSSPGRPQGSPAPERCVAGALICVSGWKTVALGPAYSKPHTPAAPVGEHQRHHLEARGKRANCPVARSEPTVGFAPMVPLPSNNAVAARLASPASEPSREARPRPRERSTQP